MNKKYLNPKEWFLNRYDMGCIKDIDKKQI